MKAGSQVSVIIPVYNGERYLAEAVHSILAQTVPTLEIIVVDDGSTDGTARVAQRFGDAVCYVYQPNRGPAAARNRGLERARGEIVAFLDADDLWREGKLACQCARLEADPTLDIVLGHTQFVQHEPGPDAGPVPTGEPYPQFFLGGALFRRSAFTRVGGFDESLLCCEDWDWFLRAYDMGVAMRMFPEVVLHYRRHEHNLTRTAAGRHDLLRVIRKRLVRQRRQGSTRLSLPSWFDAGQRTKRYE